MGFQSAEQPMLRKVMLSELPVNTRKYRKYAQFIMQYPELNEEQKQIQLQQQAKIAAGEEVIELDMIREPEPYDEKHIKVEEFEVEGAAFDEFLLSLGDFSDLVRAKTDRWKNLLNSF